MTGTNDAVGYAAATADQDVHLIDPDEDVGFPFSAVSIKLARSRERRHQERPVGGSLKRLMDIIIAIIVFISMVPMLVLASYLIYLTMGRPIFFSHRRVGFNGTTFKCYKFRTMVENAQERLDAHLRNNPEAAEEWRIYHKLKDDPRITWLGMILRKSSLDELPQLFNILRGDMSCIGPRPVTTEELQRYGSFAKCYISARPGLTGLWQVSGRSKATYDYRVALDTRYVRNWSSLLDLKILMRTIPAVFRFHESG
jgi:exopolysaccharide production protein ExoY